jgi:hypothetical protein
MHLFDKFDQIDLLYKIKRMSELDKSDEKSLSIKDLFVIDSQKSYEEFLKKLKNSKR